MMTHSESNLKSVKLHIMHSWGGGIEKWVKDYSRVDSEVNKLSLNIVLKSVGGSGISSQQLHLYNNINDQNHLRSWELHEFIYSTSITNIDYAKTLQEIVRDFKVDVIIVSSFIGHSLDILNTGIKTIVICHDYHPFCPAVNIYFQKSCTQCNDIDLQNCSNQNKNGRISPYTYYLESIPIREQYLSLINQYNISLVAPSNSVVKNLIRLEPKFRNINFMVIEHGLETATSDCITIDFDSDIVHSDKLRILILGRLEVHKGLELLRQAYKEILKVADLFLLGCGGNAEEFYGVEGIHVVKDSYFASELPNIIKKISPELSLLLSIVPETFSYTLSELMSLSIPTLATKTGSFEDRIIDGENGFLFTPLKEDLVSKVINLSSNKDKILRTKKNLQRVKPRSLKQMWNDYDSLMINSPVTCMNETQKQIILLEMSHAEILRSSIQLQAIQSELERSQSQLQYSQRQLGQLQYQLDVSQSHLQHVQSELNWSQSKILQMEMSKFWKLRSILVKLKAKASNIPLKKFTKRVIEKYRVKLSKAAKLILHSIDSKLMRFRTNVDFVDRILAKSLQKLSDYPEYSQWIQLHELTLAEINQQKTKSLQFSHRPCLSVILPVYKLPLSILKETIDSVLQQTYTNWEMCITFADTNNLSTVDYLQKLSLQDSRIKLSVTQENKGISGNSNISLGMSSGEFIVLLDHDDLLTPSAFYEVINELNKNPDLDFIYSDKDCISENSLVRSRLLLKPQWSPEILYSANYPTHLCIIRRDLVDKIGGFRSETDGAQDWDLFFRVTEQTSRIARLTSVLYHWRIIQGSTSLGIESKPYALQGQLLSIQEHLMRMQLPATVSPHPESGFRLTWTDTPTKVSIVIDGDVSGGNLLACITAVSEFADCRLHKAIVVLPEVTYKTNRTELEVILKTTSLPINFLLIKEGKSKLIALAEAAKQNIADVVLFVSGKVVKFKEEWIQELSDWVIHHPNIGFASALVLTTKDIVVEAGLVIDNLNNGYPLFRETTLYSWGIFGGSLWYRNCSASSPWALSFSYEHYLSLGGLNTDSSSVQDSIIQLCKASRANNKRGLVNPHARAFIEDLPVNDLPYFHESLSNDPYFHPALDFSTPLKLKLNK